MINNTDHINKMLNMSADEKSLYACLEANLENAIFHIDILTATIPKYKEDINSNKYIKIDAISQYEELVNAMFKLSDVMKVL